MNVFEFPAHYLARVLNYLRRVVARSTAEAVASFRNNNVKTKFLSIYVSIKISSILADMAIN